MDERARQVLIVDDNLANLKLVQVLLEVEGFAARTASSAEEAFQVVETFRPELILMDIQLPGTDGLELTRQLKQDPRFAATPVIALTSYAMKGDRDRAVAAGCDGYISKPIETRSFGDQLRAVLALRGEQPACGGS